MVEEGDHLRRKAAAAVIVAAIESIIGWEWRVGSDRLREE